MWALLSIFAEASDCRGGIEAMGTSINSECAFVQVARHQTDDCGIQVGDNCSGVYIQRELGFRSFCCWEISRIYTSLESR